jgi:hypothetical protein
MRRHNPYLMELVLVLAACMVLAALVLGSVSASGSASVGPISPGDSALLGPAHEPDATYAIPDSVIHADQPVLTESEFLVGR